MIKLCNDPTRYGRIPDPPERSECCGNCRYNHREGKDLFSCSNEDCEHYASYTGYDDWCDGYEPKDFQSSLVKDLVKDLVKEGI